MTEWRHSRWGDLATLEYGRSLRGYQNAAGQYPVFGTNGPIGHGPKPLCGHPGVIIGRKGAYRGVHYSDRPFWVIDTAFYLEPKADIDLKWAYYELLTHDINAMDSGSAIPSTSRAAFYALPVRVPPLDEQRRIAHTLGGLDDKIDLNRRMNHTLEAIARAIFKSWFVDFDPVRKKMVGGEVGLPPSLAALFPGSLTESVIGESPVGWVTSCLGDVAAQIRESVKPEDILPGTPYFGLEHLPKRSIALSDWRFADEVASNKSQFAVGDILFGKLRPYFHKVGPPPIAGVCSTDIVVVRPHSRELFAFTLGHMSSEAFVDSASAHSSGTRMPRTNWKDMAQYPLVVPPASLLRAYDDVVRPLIGLIWSGATGSRLLARVRNALIPELLAGSRGQLLEAPATNRQGEAC